VGAAAAAVVAARLAGRAETAAVAEWRGGGAAVAYAHFEATPHPRADAGPAALIDRGRFWVEWRRSARRLLVAGLAEYAFVGSFDYPEL
jgi:hypothetical protein